MTSGIFGCSFRTHICTDANVEYLGLYRNSSVRTYHPIRVSSNHLSGWSIFKMHDVLRLVSRCTAYALLLKHNSFYHPFANSFSKVSASWPTIHCTQWSACILNARCSMWIHLVFGRLKMFIRWFRDAWVCITGRVCDTKSPFISVRTDSHRHSWKCVLEKMRICG